MHQVRALLFVLPEPCIGQDTEGFFEADLYYCKGCGICARECPTTVIHMVAEEELMSKRVGMEASIAIAEAVKLAEAEVVAAYPITPQTHIVERLSELVADGELDAEYICVESEHSAMSACLGSAAVGARTFTATAGQGLELMHEVLYVAGIVRLPIVMAVANRALSGPLNVWGDHSDVMAARDCGWIQIFAENGQEAFDLTSVPSGSPKTRRCSSR